MGSLWLLKGKLNISLVVAGACAIELAIIHNFTWYYFLTWRERVARTARDYLIRLAKYNMVTASIDFVCNLSLLVVLTKYLRFHYLMANILGMLAGPVLKYFANEYLIFRRKPHLDEHFHRGSPHG